jgi:SAM-dependent methyltransferase
VRIETTVGFAELTLEGEIHCPRCGKQVGVISAAKPDLIGHPRFGLWPSAPVQIDAGALVRRPSRDFSRERSAGWTVAPAGELFSDQVGAAYRFTTRALSIDLAFLQHDWSGSVEIFVDGKRLGEVGLFMAEGSMVLRVPVYLGADGGEHVVELRVGAQRDPRSRANQVFLKGIDFVERQASTGAGPAFTVSAENRGNGYPDAFTGFLDRLPADALILDCGCGDRCYPDARVVNSEYSPFAAPDIYGDGHALPFQDATFDFVLSQAVFEHVHDPFKAAREILRVLKPGGELYCESAFMQPLHAVPYHFFNTTVWGIQKVFEDFERIAVTSEGPLHDTLSWIYGLTSLREKGHGKEVDQLLSLVKSLDQHITHEELRKFSSFVTFHGRRPVTRP